MAVGDAGDHTINRRPVDMHIQHRQENRYAPARRVAKAEFLRWRRHFDRNDVTIRRCDEQACPRGHDAFRVAEEIQAEQRENSAKPGEPPGPNQADQRHHRAAGNKRPPRAMWRGQNKFQRCA